MKYFLDTEFYERPNQIDLISLGVVDESGRTFYAENTEIEMSLFDAQPWLKENVLPHLRRTDIGKGRGISRADTGTTETVVFSSPEGIGHQFKAWVGDDPRPEFWSWYADYDWVVLCWCFGAMMDLPKGFPMYCRDIQQVIDAKGHPKRPKQTGAGHDALSDALYHRRLYEWITAYEPNMSQ